MEEVSIFKGGDSYRLAFWFWHVGWQLLLDVSIDTIHPVIDLYLVLVHAVVRDLGPKPDCCIRVLA